MSLRINTNVAALNSYNNLNANQAKLEGAFQQLSSGLRINKAADDAAGLSIAQGLTSQINGLTQAVSNANDGINVAQIADGALGTSQDILQRMRGLIVKAGNEGTQDTKSLGAIQQEIQNLNTQLNNIASQTKFGQTNLLDGKYNKNFQVGANGGDTIKLDLSKASVTASDLGVSKLNIVTGGGTLVSGTANAYGFGVGVQADANSGAALADTNLIGALTTAGLTGTYKLESAPSGGDGWVLKDNVTGAQVGTIAQNANGSFTITKDDGTGATAPEVLATVDTTHFDTSFSASGVTAATDLDTATVTGNMLAVGTVLNDTFTSNTADAFQIDAGTTSGTVTTYNVSNSSDAGFAATMSYDSATNIYTIKDSTGNVVGGVNTNMGAVPYSGLDAYGSSQASADLDSLSAAIDTVSAARSQIGAVQNQLSYTVSNLQTAITNVTASRSNLTDADLAQQVTAMTQSQILTQAATSVLAQANSAPQAILKLLQ